jgi:protein-S-isoprenylcysteine O-methyltransferase Ste14
MCPSLWCTAGIGDYVLSVPRSRLRLVDAPALMQVPGGLITLWSIWFCYRTMRENSFAAPVIKLQQERGQRVISTGAYAFVRHPMYFGAGHGCGLAGQPHAILVFYRAWSGFGLASK